MEGVRTSSRASTSHDYKKLNSTGKMAYLTTMEHEVAHTADIGRQEKEHYLKFEAQVAEIKQMVQQKACLSL